MVARIRKPHLRILVGVVVVVVVRCRNPEQSPDLKEPPGRVVGTARAGGTTTGTKPTPVVVAMARAVQPDLIIRRVT